MTKLLTSVSRAKGLMHWLETKYFAPEFAGGMLIGISGFFFLAATNTLAGWLYVISGVSFALLLIGAVMPARLLKDIEIVRSPLEPVSAGDVLVVELIFHNNSKAAKALLQVSDILPPQLSQVVVAEEIIEQLLPKQYYRWIYSIPTQRRGVFQFNLVQLLTASPFGLFRSRRTQSTDKSNQHSAIIYPTVLALPECPLIDQTGRDDSPKQYSLEHTHNNASEGITKTLRPYRWGDPIRLVHWRTSARFGELRVRELEMTVGGQELVIALDTEPGWQEVAFEQAVVAAASLYFYAQRLNLNVKLWTPFTGLQHGDRLVLETLARAEVTTPKSADLAEIPDLPLVWITHRSDTLGTLSLGSRWLLWQSVSSQAPNNQQTPGLIIENEATEVGEEMYRSLQNQLQGRL